MTLTISKMVTSKPFVISCKFIDKKQTTLLRPTNLLQILPKIPPCYFFVLTQPHLFPEMALQLFGLAVINRGNTALEFGTPSSFNGVRVFVVGSHVSFGMIDDQMQLLKVRFMMQEMGGMDSYRALAACKNFVMVVEQERMVLDVLFWLWRW